MRTTAVIIAKNEEKEIGKCLESVSFCDELIVIDDNSTDKTAEIAERLGAKVFSHSLKDDFSAQRNFGLEKAGGDWVLFIDADEIVSGDLKREIVKVVNAESDINGYYIKRDDYLWGRKLVYGETGKTKLLRLAKKGSGLWKRRVHESWEIKGKTGTLKNPIRHYPHQNLKTFITHLEEFSTLHARANYDEGKKSDLGKIVFYPVFKLFQNYIIRFGFRDGTPGMVHALLMSFHSYLSWSKLWLRQKELMSKRY